MDNAILIDNAIEFYQLSYKFSIEQLRSQYFLEKVNNISLLLKMYRINL